MSETRDCPACDGKGIIHFGQHGDERECSTFHCLFVCDECDGKGEVDDN